MNIEPLQDTAQLRSKTEQTPNLALVAKSKAIRTHHRQQVRSHEGPRTNSDPEFRIYPVEQGVAIIRAIAEHRWPMHLTEAFALRDQFRWKPAPDDGTIFTTPVSSGDEDGFIGIDVENKNLVAEVRFRLSSRLPQDTQPEIQVRIQNAYASYISAFNSLYGAGDSESDQDVAITQWYLPSRANVAIAATRRFLSTTIESPATTDLAEAQQRYFDEGGEM